MELDRTRIIALALGGIVVAVLGAGACCAGGWVALGPVNYLGCDTNTPPGISAADLVGEYGTADGAGLRLDADGTLGATALFDEDSGDLSGAGRWELRDGEIGLTLRGGHGRHLDISGTREHPWLYWFVGDPDRCNLYRFNKI